jgi:WD40 repeat protein
VRSIPLGAAYDVAQGTPRGAAISPDGATLAVTQSDGTIELFDARTLRRRATLSVGEAPVLGLAFSPNGRLLATSSDGGQVTLVDTASWTRVAELDGLSAWAEPLAFSPDGRYLASSAVHVDPSRIAMWDVRRRSALPPAGTAAATALAFSPDGRRLAAATSAGVTDIRDAAGGRLLRRLRTAAPPRAVAFSPDGSLLFVGLLDGTGQFFSTRTWEPSGPDVRGQSRRLTSAGFTPDGLTLFTASADGSVMLWDVASRKAIGPPVVVEPDVPVTAVLSPGGASLYALPTGSRGLRLSISVAAWKRRACSIAGRELTAREWREALPRHDRRSVCAPAG